MYYFRQCKCGSTDFEKETDDEVYRCAECGRLAEFGYVNDEEEKEANENLFNDN